MNRNARHQQRGFTLAEILVTTAIFAIIMIAALTVYDKSNKVFRSGTESADLQQSTRIGFDKLVADLRMAGFDYNRGGNPTGTGQFPQPDEQIEYAGKNAIVFRSNFNYNVASATGNGLEPAFTPVDPATGSPIFPFVTTSNDEIVAYVLRSADATKNTSSISFYLDKDRPRSAYPGGSAESLVKISSTLCASCGIDTTNDNPPYTLYRMTMSDILNRVPGTPVAENIRSLTFFYYTDANGVNVLKNSDGPPATDIVNTRDADGSTSTPATATFVNQDGTTTTLNTGAIGGAGQYDPASPGTAANYTDRSSRTTIQSVRVSLVGLNANPDAGYSQKTETIARIKNYKQYQLSALVVPRNLGLTGFPEPSNVVPSPPTITGICTAACAAPVICWTAPTGGGPVEQYRIEWDSNPNGSFTSSLTITDPTATSATIQDIGLIDPSVTWFYHILAQNENGTSLPSQPMSVQPKNSTKPMPPTFGVNPVTTPTNYGLTLGWTSPATNDPSVASSTCTGSGCSTDATAIPPQELIHYRIYRGLTANFDPSVAGQSVTVLTTGSGTQPATTPGSPTTWEDSPTKSAFPPGTCVQYFYRVQAADRCILSNAYNTSNNLNDSLSKMAPPVAQATTITGTAADNPSAQAVAPPDLKVNTVTSACPAPLTSNCKIDLTWSKVTSDTAGAAIGVDRYRITRYRKKQTDTTFALDTTFNATGSLDVKGYSQTNTGIIGYSDVSAPSFDVTDGNLWYYEYKVAADDCRLGLISPPADFPTPCASSPIIVQFGATNGSDSADTPSNAWIMNAGDTISANPPVGLTLASVTFAVTAFPSGAVVDSPPPDTVAPFTYTWSDRSDGQVYQVRITSVTNSGCTEVHVKYVQDQQAAPCSFPNRSLVANSAAKAGSITTLSQSYTITNNGADPMQVASKPIKVTWAIPAGDSDHDDMVMTAIAYTTTTDNFTGVGPGTVTRSIPSSITNIAPGASLTITLRWQFKKTDNTFTGQQLGKVCLDYAIASEPGITKHCNLVGQSATTNNPNSCD